MEGKFLRQITETLRLGIRWKCLSQHIHSVSAQGQGLIRDMDLRLTFGHESGEGHTMRWAVKDQKKDTEEPQSWWHRQRQKRQKGRTRQARQSGEGETSKARLETEL